MAFNLQLFMQLVQQFAPAIVAAVVPGGATYGPLISDAIIEEETLRGNAPGTAKRAAVVAATSTAIALRNQIQSGRPAVDPAVVAAQAGQAVDLTIGLINSIKALQQAVVVPPVAGSAVA